MCLPDARVFDVLVALWCFLLWGLELLGGVLVAYILVVDLFCFIFVVFCFCVGCLVFDLLVYLFFTILRWVSGFYWLFGLCLEGFDVCFWCLLVEFVVLGVLSWCCCLRL